MSRRASMKHTPPQHGISLAHEPPPVRGLSPALVGLILGICAALPMYLWQLNVEIAAASFVVVGYTAWLWTHAHNHALWSGALYAELRRLPVNAPARRTWRMLIDPGFWWTIVFGGLVVSGSVWYAGMRESLIVAGIAGVWCLIAACLRFGLTIVRPTSRCRRCGYDLTGQLAMTEESRAIVCSECGARWSRAQLGHAAAAANIDWRKRRAA